MKIIKFYTKYINGERMKKMKKLTDGKKAGTKSKKASIKSRQVLVGALAVMVVAAGYYRYSISNMETETETVAVVNTGDTQEENYFASARKERDSARSEAEELVREIADSEDATADAKAEADSKLKKIAENIKKEGEIESLIKAKGYEDCIVFIDENEVRVIVNADKLESDKVAQISDIVTSKTNFKPSQIVIGNEKKK